MDINRFEKLFTQTIKSKQIHECVLLVENTNGDFTYKNEYGGKDVDAPLLIASITKLFTTACILILREQGKLSLDDEVTEYFDSSTLSRLHIYKGQEYSSKLTIYNLLSQTSGLPDAFEEGKNSLKKRVLGEDMQFTFDEMITLTKQLKPHFAPDSMKRAHYADVNFDLLGEIIETITDSSLEDVYQSLIFEPLGLVKTYLPKSEHDVVPSIYYRETAISRPKFIKSCRASGGVISTARELMIFIKAFFGGNLFKKDVFHQLKKYRKLQTSMYPIQYGGGFMRISLNGLPTLFMGKGELVGHSGSTGSFAFFYPDKELFLVGDANQLANPALPIRMAMRLAISIK
ncbi:serine hydrolase domain-containing protein [Bacillus sp. B15-48]|uniref:serine hydrolase domain-containing protein n=1 Tax=Bacillus sp. B15-48 TaxID=1548601 RepID=UPI00193FBC65|nr:serine hydrolase domain-containing protein [Bacillus sp. B15-48]MBM4763719.1 serine hydrolase [Bacillus sp. B15-48]